MKLTGKCKEDFEKWYSKEYPTELIFSQHNESLFREIPNAFKYGVLVDWFESVEIEIGRFKNTVEILDKVGNKCHYIEELKTRPEARTAAIDKANEIYNK